MDRPLWDTSHPAQHLKVILTGQVLVLTRRGIPLLGQHLRTQSFQGSAEAKKKAIRK
jgi:hypothetical protein